MLFRRYLLEIQYGGHEKGRHIEHPDRHFEFLIYFDENAAKSILHCDGDPRFPENMVLALEITFLSAIGPEL